jgi:hypothetical protein
MTFNKYAIIGWIAIVLAGCGLTPSDAEVERALTKGDALIGKAYQIANLRRLNGYQRNDGYVVEFSAEIHVLENPKEYLSRRSQNDKTGIGALAAIGLATEGLAKWGLVTSAELVASKKGDIIPFSGAMLLIKSEQGWIRTPAN